MSVTTTDDELQLVNAAKAQAMLAINALDADDARHRLRLPPRGGRSGKTARAGSGLYGTGKTGGIRTPRLPLRAVVGGRPKRGTAVHTDGLTCPPQDDASGGPAGYF